MEISRQSEEKIRKVKLLVLDVDGVLTDGRIIYDSSGKDLKCFDVHDGMGVCVLKKAGIDTVLVSAKSSRTIRKRIKDMNVTEYYEGVSPKISALERILRKNGVRPEEICFVGDDLVDLCLMKATGFPVAVANACPDIKEAASYVTQKSGGRGAVREVAELILKTQGKWDTVIKLYK